MSAFALWPEFKAMGVAGFHSKADSLAFTFIAIAAWLMNPTALIWQLTVVATVNRTLDEFIFDPFTREWNEWVLFVMFAAAIVAHNSFNKWVRS
jgi:hypothetical protein